MEPKSNGSSNDNFCDLLPPLHLPYSSQYSPACDRPCCDLLGVSWPGRAAPSPPATAERGAVRAGCSLPSLFRPHSSVLQVCLDVSDLADGRSGRKAQRGVRVTSEECELSNVTCCDSIIGSGMTVVSWSVGFSAQCFVNGVRRSVRVNCEQVLRMGKPQGDSALVRILGLRRRERTAVVLYDFTPRDDHL